MPERPAEPDRIPVRTSAVSAVRIVPPPDFNKLGALLHSRKFWTTAAATAVTVYLYATGELSAESFADSAVLIAGIYVGSVALEDGLRNLVNLWTRA